MKRYLKLVVGFLSNRSFTLPILNIILTRRCNARCITCEYWRGDAGEELTLEDYRSLLEELSELEPYAVALTGGEPLLRRDVFALAEGVKRMGVRCYLITNGILLERYVDETAELFDQVWVSLDAPSAELHDRLRGVECFEKIVDGLRKLKSRTPSPTVEIRSLVHRENFRVMREIVSFVREVGVDRISFLPVDVESEAFGRDTVPASRDTLLTPREEIGELEREVEEFIQTYTGEIKSGFIRGGEKELRWLVHHYRRYCGLERKSRFVNCLAPFVSTVIDSDGAVRPCYFLPPVGNIKHQSLREILNNTAYRSIRKRFKRGEIKECKLCVCPLRLRLKA